MFKFLTFKTFCIVLAVLVGLAIIVFCLSRKSNAQERDELRSTVQTQEKIMQSAANEIHTARCGILRTLSIDCLGTGKQCEELTASRQFYMDTYGRMPEAGCKITSSGSFSFIPKAHAEELLVFGTSSAPALVLPSLEPDPYVYDLDKLAQAVSVAETSGCKDGTAQKRMNCFGIMTWKTGTRQPKYYASHAESFQDFKRIWSKYYKKFPDLALAHKWTGSDSPETWLANVCHIYPHPSCS